jgi:type I protein arginine methyltransferase
MTHADMDFTSTIELRLRPSHVEDHINWCHGLVLWFDTDFTARFCKENATSLSTSPFGPKTHWAQTILTFREPIAMCNENGRPVVSGVPMLKEIGTEECPVTMVRIRVSIARASHRSIDISLEATAVSSDGKKNWPVQIFNL